MDEMKFELGNPQEDAPKRIEPKNNKKKWLRLGIVAAAVLLVVVIAVLWDSTSFDGLRRGIIYARADKDESGCAQLYQYSNERNACFASVDGSLITASVGQLHVLGEDGTASYSTIRARLRCSQHCAAI